MTISSRLWLRSCTTTTRKNQKLGKLPQGCQFNMINFVDVEYSRRVNSIQAKYINNLAAASETAEDAVGEPAKRQERGEAVAATSSSRPRL